MAKQDLTKLAAAVSQQLKANEAQDAQRAGAVLGQIAIQGVEAADEPMEAPQAAQEAPQAAPVANPSISPSVVPKLGMDLETLGKIAKKSVVKNAEWAWTLGRAIHFAKIESKK